MEFQLATDSYGHRKSFHLIYKAVIPDCDCGPEHINATAVLQNITNPWFPNASCINFKCKYKIKAEGYKGIVIRIIKFEKMRHSDKLEIFGGREASLVNRLMVLSGDQRSQKNETVQINENIGHIWITAELTAIFHITYQAQGASPHLPQTLSPNILLTSTTSVITAATDINECASDPCANGGTCNDMVNAYTCTCQPGWTGTHCKIDISECASNPCVNGGTCNDIFNGYICTCQPGWTGIHCKIIDSQDEPQPSHSDGSNPLFGSTLGTIAAGILLFLAFNISCCSCIFGCIYWRKKRKEAAFQVPAVHYRVPQTVPEPSPVPRSTNPVCGPSGSASVHRPDRPPPVSFLKKSAKEGPLCPGCEVEQVSYIIPCGHKLCQNCLNRILGGTKNGEGTCPTTCCGAKFTREESIYDYID